MPLLLILMNKGRGGRRWRAAPSGPTVSDRLKGTSGGFGIAIAFQLMDLAFSWAVFPESFVYIRSLQGALPGGRPEGRPPGKESICDFDTRDNSFRILSLTSDGGFSPFHPSPWSTRNS